MKIAYVTVQGNRLRWDEAADYMSDLLFHGLRSIYGDAVVEYPQKYYMYTDMPAENSTKLWGKGFSYSRTLDPIEVDRNNIQSRIINGEFDLLVVSIHHSVQGARQTETGIRVTDSSQAEAAMGPFFEMVPKTTKVAIVDGHDWATYHKGWFKYTDLVFKREIENSPHIPISFAIPEEKIVDHVPNKVRNFANIVPGSNEAHWPKDSRKTHVYETEEEYYKDYQDSYFAFTCKKGGWDCMRHYEILANGCIPLFTDIEDCPEKTLTTLSKGILTANKLLGGLNIARSCESVTFGGHLLQSEECSYYHGRSYLSCTNGLQLQGALEGNLKYCRENLTTKVLAETFIERCMG